MHPDEYNAGTMIIKEGDAGSLVYVMECESLLRHLLCIVRVCRVQNYVLHLHFYRGLIIANGNGWQHMRQLLLCIRMN